MPKPKKHVLVCVQARPPPGHSRGSCQQADCAAVYQDFLDAFQARNLWSEYAVTNTGCLGPCSSGPPVGCFVDEVTQTYSND